MFRNLSLFLNQPEDRQYFPASFSDSRVQVLSVCPGQVLMETAARDMGDGMNIHFLKKLQNRLDIDLRRCQKNFTERSAELFGIAADLIAHLNIEYLSDKREAVGMYAGRRKTDNDIPFLHVLLVQNLLHALQFFLPYMVR